MAKIRARTSQAKKSCPRNDLVHVFLNGIALNSPTGKPLGTAEFIAAWKNGFDATLASLLSSQAKVLHLRDLPRFRDDVAECLQTARNQADCSVKRSEGIRPLWSALWQHEVSQSENTANYRALDLTDMFCDQSRCTPVEPDGRPRFQDSNHLDWDFSAKLWPLLSSNIARMIDLPPAHVENLRAVVKRGRAVLTWVPSHPGSAEVVEYRVTLKPSGKGKKLGAKINRARTNLTKYRSPRLVKDAKYKVKVTAINTIGTSPTVRAKLRS
jgi:hypothetical protein